MAPLVNEPGHPQGVSVHLVSKETDVMCVLRGSREMVASNVHLVSKVMTVNNALDVSKAMIVSSVHSSTMEMNAVMLLSTAYEIWSKVMFLRVFVCP